MNIPETGKSQHHLESVGIVEYQKVQQIVGDESGQLPQQYDSYKYGQEYTNCALEEFKQNIQEINENDLCHDEDDQDKYVHHERLSTDEEEEEEEQKDYQHDDIDNEDDSSDYQVSSNSRNMID